MAILLCLVETASAVAAKSPEKTASGIFFTDPNIYTGEILSESPQLQWEIDPAATPTASGRQDWLSADPVGEERGGLNLYSYVGGDPLNQSDPLGLCPLASPETARLWANTNTGTGDVTPAQAVGFMTGAIAANVVAAAGIYGGGMIAAGPSTLYHFTSAEGYASIMSQGFIRAGSGLFGRGVYASAFASPFIARLMGAQATEKCVKIAAEGLQKAPTLIPGAYRILQDVGSTFFK